MQALENVSRGSGCKILTARSAELVSNYSAESRVESAEDVDKVAVRVWLAALSGDGNLPSMTVAQLPIAIDRERIARFCRERGVRSLTLFGSVLREDFDPERSDIDVLAEFAPGALRGVGLRYFDFAEELGAILGHRVDFSSQLHPLLRDRVNREAVKVYEQA